MKTIVDRIGKPALLEQTAEECTELAHACLKEARRLRGENPTPATEAECRAAIREEMADVSVCLGRLNEAGYPIDMRAVRAKIERWESCICARNAGEAANSPLDDVLGHEVTSYLSSIKTASEGDLIRRGEAMNAIRRARVLSHIPWKSSSPEGRTTLEALKAINDTPPVQWTPKEAACLVFDMVAERHIASSAPLDFVCSCVYGEMDQEFRTHAGIGMDGKSCKALIDNSGIYADRTTYQMTGAEGTDERSCRLVAINKNTGEPVVGPAVSIKMAKDSGWWNKNGSYWPKMPEMMLRYRAAAYFARTECPEVLMGANIDMADGPEEVSAL